MRSLFWAPKVPACWKSSIAINAPDSARLRTTTGLDSCELNSRRPTRVSAAMVRTMLAMPARLCSFSGRRRDRGLRRRRDVGDHPVEHRATKSSLSVKLS